MKIGSVSRDISIQTVYNTTLENTFFSLKEHGFTGIELNLPELYCDITPSKLRNVLDSWGLSMNYLATGAYAKKRHLSLSSPDEDLRIASVTGLMQNIAYASDLGCGVIVGFFKGTFCDNKDAAMNALYKSICQVVSYAENKDVTVLLEITNSKETSVLTCLQEGASFVDAIGSSNIRLLADTYHMSIEEDNILNAFNSYLNYLPHIHLSDDNRFLPGFGSLDFRTVVQKLDSLGYSGTFAIEGNINHSVDEDLKHVSEYLGSI